MNAYDLSQLLAAEVAGIPGWQWSSSEAIDPPGTLLMTGAVYPVTYKSGPRKGRTNYGKPTPGTERKIVVTRAQRDEFFARWEQSSGVCSDCFGDKGREVWSTKANAKQWQTCKRCNGTGGVEGVERVEDPAKTAPVDAQASLFGGTR